MEMQCKERVDLLEALRKSRDEVKDSGRKLSSGGLLRGRPPPLAKSDLSTGQTTLGGSIGEGTIPAVNYPDLSRPPPPLPQRPAILQKKSSEFSADRLYSNSQIPTSGSPLPYALPNLPVPSKHTSRTPSPEKKSRMLTTLRTKDRKRPSRSPRPSSGRVSYPPHASSKAAGLAWDSTSRGSGQRLGQLSAGRNPSTVTVDSLRRTSIEESHATPHSAHSESATSTDKEDPFSWANDSVRLHAPFDPTTSESLGLDGHRNAAIVPGQDRISESTSHTPQAQTDLGPLDPPTPPLHDHHANGSTATSLRARSPPKPRPPVDYLSYRSEYPPAPPPSSKLMAQLNASANHRPSEGFRTASLPTRQRSPQRKNRPLAPNGISRRPVPGLSPRQPENEGNHRHRKSSDSGDENTSSSREAAEEIRRVPRKPRKKAPTQNPSIASSERAKKDLESLDPPTASTAWEERVKYTKKHLPRGVDPEAAKQIFNEIVVQGDEVHWDDVAGLDIAKKALKEAVVYPFLRPDLFMGLREPARGMLLFGPPGTGKTMLARAVATESRSTFFAISASSLTSKWLGESEKLVRALFSLAKALAPSIIFVDEIDSLLSSRGGSSEHESTRRIKTEFLIQWSDLQKAAAGKAQTDKEKQEGDASRVLVLAATNLPWAIDEAARRRFVRRQYIPLPEPHVRVEQLKTLLGHQKHNLKQEDIEALVLLTDGNRPPLPSSVHLFYHRFLTSYSRLLRLRYYSSGKRRSNGSAPQSRRGFTFHVHGRYQTNRVRGFRSQSDQYQTVREQTGSPGIRGLGQGVWRAWWIGPRAGAAISRRVSCNFSPWAIFWSIEGELIGHVMSECPNVVRGSRESG